MTASKNKKAMTAAERAHVERVKGLRCAVCDQPGPSDAHEIEQGKYWLTIPLCRHCHSHQLDGLHGEKRMWLVTKSTELGCLNATIAILYGTRP